MGPSATVLKTVNTIPRSMMFFTRAIAASLPTVAIAYDWRWVVLVMMLSAINDAALARSFALIDAQNASTIAMFARSVSVVMTLPISTWARTGASAQNA